MDDIEWPAQWQDEARKALAPYFGIETRVRVVVGTTASISGTVMEGFMYLDGAVPMCIYERSDRPDLYPWRLLQGPVLRIEERRPRRKALVVYAHPEWSPRDRKRPAPPKQPS